MLEYRQKKDFYVDGEFGEIPKGWSLKKFIKCFEFFPNASYSREQLSEQGDCCYIHYGDIHTKFDGFLDFKKEKLPFVENKMASRFTKLKEGDLIIADASEDYDGVGKAVEILNIGDRNAIAGLHTLHLRAIDDCLINGFKAYVLNNGDVRNKILRSATGIKVYSISKSSLKNILIPVPPPAEQRTIASILSKVDEAITTTKNSIAKAERLKKALMQNLLTGKLKPDGTWRKDDEYYEDDKFGFLPIGWEVKPLKQLATVQRGKFSHRPRNEPRFYDGIHPFVQTSDVVNSVFYLKEHSQTLSDAGTAVSRKFPKGTIIITIAANIGDVAITNYDVYFPDSLIGINHNEELINDEFLLISLMTKKQFLNQVSTESAQKNINYGNLRPLPIFLPTDKTEQIKIAEKIKAVFNVIEEKQTKVKKLERLKKALMQNLLTGKVRVKIKETVNG